MMEYLYIDEKGPQETIKKITVPFDKAKKLKYGDDNMHVYVADMIRIPYEKSSNIEAEYVALERNYLEKRQFKKGKELKGKDILKSNFKFGVASLKKNELSFFRRLFEMLLNYETDNLLFSISKMALLIDSRLNEWILDAGERFPFSAILLKYALTKYAEVEASEDVIKALLDKSIDIKRVLQAIKYDMNNIIYNNKDNKRMRKQILTFQQIVNLIQETENQEINEPDFSAVFNWEKVAYNIGLWGDEKRYNGISLDKMIVLLDEGIPKTPFENIGFHNVKEGNKSSEVVGLRITDILVVIAGNYISKLSADTIYNFEKPEERKILSCDWFKLNKDQFEVICMMKKFFLRDNQKFCFIVDTYFDSSVIFESFLNYISSYRNFREYSKVDVSIHAENHYRSTAENMKKRWELSFDIEDHIKNNYGSLRKAINLGLFHPL